MIVLMQAMRISIRCLIVIALALSSALTKPVLPAVAQQRSDLVHLAQRLLPQVVMIEAKGEGELQGSGFILAPGDQVVTNYHVIAGGRTATVTFADGRVVQVTRIVAADVERDIAILKIVPRGPAIATLGDSDTVKVGQQVFVVGSPEGFQNTLTDGLVSGIRKLRGQPRIQISAPVSHGSSGGPVFNPDWWDAGY